MKKTLQTIQILLDDIKGDVKLLKLTPIEKKVERVSQLLEAVVRELTSKSDIAKDEAEFIRQYDNCNGYEDGDNFK